MRLTDKEIEEKAHANTNEFFDELFYESGMKAARDFYENQKCGACRDNGKCFIIIALKEKGYTFHSFGCTLWEAKK